MLVGSVVGILQWEPGWDEPRPWSDTGNFARVSPDGSSVVYQRRYADGSRVFIEPLEKTQGQRVAIGNGTAPRFREDGREIVWCDGRKVMSVDLDGDTRQVGD